MGSFTLNLDQIIFVLNAACWMGPYGSLPLCTQVLHTQTVRTMSLSKSQSIQAKDFSPKCGNNNIVVNSEICGRCQKADAAIDKVRL